MKYLVLKGCAGLGNRLITVARAVKYARATGRTLHVDWSDGMFGPKGTNIFPRYFRLAYTDTEPSLEPVLEALEAGASTLPEGLTAYELTHNIYRNFNTSGSPLASLPAYRAAVSRFAKGTLSVIAGLQAWHRDRDRTFGYMERVRGVASGQMFPVGECLPEDIDRDIVVFADFRPYVELSQILGEIELVPEIETTFRQFADEKSLALNGTGVHIRATDKQPPSSYEKLLRTLARRLADNPEEVIFLSTDNPKVEEEFRTRFGQERLVIYPKTMPEEGFEKGLHQWALWHGDKEMKEQMFRESLADMWLLGMCRNLYWQGNSSFSLISSLMHTGNGVLKDWLKL